MFLIESVEQVNIFSHTEHCPTGPLRLDVFCWGDSEDNEFPGYSIWRPISVLLGRDSLVLSTEFGLEWRAKLVEHCGSVSACRLLPTTQIFWCLSKSFATNTTNKTAVIIRLFKVRKSYSNLMGYVLWHLTMMETLLEALFSIHVFGFGCKFIFLKKPLWLADFDRLILFVKQPLWAVFLCFSFLREPKFLPQTTHTAFKDFLLPVFK